MQRLKLNLLRRNEGQSLIEAIFVIPIFLLFAFNAINIGYFFFVYLNMATAPRQGAEYSIQGGTTIYGTSYPSADDVNTLVQAGTAGSLPNGNNIPTRICTAALGTSGTNDSTQVPLCNTYGSGSGTFTTLQPDPEAPLLVLNRVDVQYTVTPLIGGSFFNLVFPPSGLTFHRWVYMRAE